MKHSQKYPVNAGVTQGFILGPTLFILYINDFPDDAICVIPIYANNITLYSKCDQAFDLWQNLELASQLESDLQETVGWGTKQLIDFNAQKTQLVSFDYNLGHNIFRLPDVLPNFSFTTSEMNRDYQ